MPKKMELWILNHSCCIIILKQRKLQSNPTLKGISHVVVDEVHERDINTDLLLALLRTSLNENPDLRVVLMSATGDNHRLAQYFGCCPIVKVPGFVHPVRDKYLEDVLKEMGRRSQVPERAKTDKENDATPDLDLVADIIEHIDRCGEPAACLTRDPFHNSLQNRALVNKAKEALSGSSYSDYLVVSRAVLGWRKVQQEGTAVLVLESIVKSLNLSGTL